MRTVKRVFRAFLVLSVLFFALYFSWMHAFVVWIVAKNDCPAELVALAKKDVARMFGDVRATPLWICAKKPVLALDVSHGTTRSAYLLPSIIVVGKKGARRNVMAHEYMHAELAERTKLRYLLLPTWFDEGLAMQVDHRRAYSRKALKRRLRRKGTGKPRLDELASSRRFYERDKARLNYAFASCVVGRWLKAQGKGQPLDLINVISWSKPFPIEKFRKYERLCLKT